jgi:hypothetical protein
MVEIRCLFDSSKICTKDCKLHDFIEIAKALGAIETKEPKPKDLELESQCKLKEN